MMYDKMNEHTYHLLDFILERVIENLRSKYEKVLDILASLCRRLEMEHNAAILLKLLDAIQRDLSLLLHIFLIANEE